MINLFEMLRNLKYGFALLASSLVLLACSTSTRKNEPKSPPPPSDKSEQVSRGEDPGAGVGTWNCFSFVQAEKIRKCLPSPDSCEAEYSGAVGAGVQATACEHKKAPTAQCFSHCTKSIPCRWICGLSVDDCKALKQRERELPDPTDPTTAMSDCRPLEMEEFRRLPGDGWWCYTQGAGSLCHRRKEECVEAHDYAVAEGRTPTSPCEQRDKAACHSYLPAPDSSQFYALCSGELSECEMGLLLVDDSSKGTDPSECDMWD